MKIFFTKLLLLFRNKLPDYNEYAKTGMALLDARKKIKLLEQENTFLKSTQLAIPVAGFDVSDIEPLDEKDRGRYAGRVSEFFDDILKNKLRKSISEIRQTLANVGIEPNIPANMKREHYDSFLRGMEASLWSIHDWAITLQGELKDKQ